MWYAQSEVKRLQAEYDAALKADQERSANLLTAQRLAAELARIETMVQTRADWSRQLAELADMTAPAQADIDAMTKRALWIVTELAELEVLQKRWVAATHDAKRQAEAKQQASQTAAELVALKAVVRAVEVLQAEMVKEVFSGILADANKFCDGILLSSLAYHDGEIGRWAGNNWVPHRSFSGTEQLISCAGISVALARQSPVKVVLLDELGRLTTENKRKLVGRLVVLAGEGFIDQAVLIDVSAEAYKDMAGIQLIEI